MSSADMDVRLARTHQPGYQHTLTADVRWLSHRTVFKEVSLVAAPVVGSVAFCVGSSSDKQS
jgi:hypothetical protein